MTTGGIERKKDDLASGTQIGRYRIEHPVGRGGMGTVYSAYDETTNRVVALKLLADGIPASLRERFLAECEAEANIRHEHVMPVYDRGWLNEERPYFVMELLYQPITLTELMDEIDHGTLGTNHPRIRQWSDLRRLVGDVLLPICEGVAVANEEYGVQHRDLKPDNVLLDIRTRRAYLIDFGICRAMDDEKDAGKIVGTPRFLSPEQAAGQISDLTDVWGLGALLRYAVTGEPPLLGTSPFTREEVQARIAALKKAEAKAVESGNEAQARGYAGRRAQLEDPTLRVQEDLLSDAVAGVYLPLPEGTSAGYTAIIKKAMAVRPEDRYESASALVKDLRTWLKGGSVQALAEEGRRGAAVDFVQRLLNRNVVRGGGALVTLFVGFLIGSGLFSKTPPPADHRIEDAQQMIAGLSAATTALRAETPTREFTAVGVSALLDFMDGEAAQIERRLLAEPEGPERERASVANAQMRAQLDRASRVRIKGVPSTTWTVQGFGGGIEEVKGNMLVLEPGVYQLQSSEAHVHLRLAVPPGSGFGFRTGAGSPQREVDYGAAGDLPEGMVRIPAGPARADEEAPIPAFVASRDWVTNEKYSEWLDDLADAPRQERVPAAGFRRSESDPRRWLVEAGATNKPVVGIRPAYAREYARWRAEVEGLDYELPTASQWNRLAAIDLMGTPGYGPVFRWHMRTGSPHGVLRVFRGPGEIVGADEGEGFVIKGEGGVLPMPSAIERATPLPAEATGHALGFRLVYRP